MSKLLGSSAGIKLKICKKPGFCKLLIFRKLGYFKLKIWDNEG